MPTLPFFFRILVADDDEHFLKMARMLLEHAGFAVTTAATAEAVLAELAQNEASVAICDIRMPGNEQLQLATEIALRHPGLPIVLATGSPSLETAVQATNSGIVAYLLKPITAAELLNTVERALGHYETRHALEKSQDTVRKWNADLEKLGRIMTDNRASLNANSTQLFLDVSLENVNQALADFRSIVTVLSQTPGRADNLRTHELETALRKAIEVIEGTKSSFKVKELADLRRQLEAVLSQR